MDLIQPIVRSCGCYSLF